MPDFYAEGEYDLSGFAVGTVKKDSVINGKNIVDILVGILVEENSSQVVSITGMGGLECLEVDLATTQARIQGDRRGTSRKGRWSVGNTKIFGRSLIIYGEKEIGPNQESMFLLPCYQNDVGKNTKADLLPIERASEMLQMDKLYHNAMDIHSTTRLETLSTALNVLLKLHLHL
ncbi:unnamed protein product [Brassica oleracea]